MVCAPTIRPPPPSPWTARNAISSIIEWDRPDSAEPTRKITIEAWKNVFRPYMSPSLPHSGVDTVEASRYAVMTQDRCDSPCRSPAMVGSAVATIVWSRAASSMPSSSAPMMISTRRGAMAAGPGSAAAAASVVLVMRAHLSQHPILARRPLVPVMDPGVSTRH